MLNCDCATNENLVAETSSLLVKSSRKGCVFNYRVSLFHNLQFFCIKLMREDWVHFQVGMHLQLGILRYIHCMKWGIQL